MGSETKYVWPWVAILANLPTQVNNNTGQRVGKSGATLRDEFIGKGFDITRVEPIWSFKGHSGFAMVEFKRDFQGFENVIRFEKSFVLDRHGKRDWENGVRLRDDKLYGWAAREEDYNRKDEVGKKLRKKTDLISVSQLEREEKRKMEQLVESMYRTIETKEKCKQELEEKVLETSYVLEKVTLENFLLNKLHQEGIEAMNMNIEAIHQQILQEHEQSMAEVEAENERLKERERQIEQQTKIHEEEMEKWRRKSEKDKMAVLIQNEIDEEVKNLALKQKKEMEDLHKKAMKMQADLNERHELELEIEILKGSNSVMNHMVESDGDANMEAKMAEIRRELDARVMVLQDRMVTLTQKERETNDEYQENRKELIMFWNSNEESMRKEKIRVKRMGQLNPEPFLSAVMKKDRCSNSRAEIKAVHLCSMWETYIGDTQWHPFKIDASDGIPKRVVDENDHKLCNLKSEYGEEVFNEVVRAKREMEEHNPSGGYVVTELWNFQANRKATLKEAAEVMLKIWSASNKNKRMKL